MVFISSPHFIQLFFLLLLSSILHKFPFRERTGEMNRTRSLYEVVGSSPLPCISVSLLPGLLKSFCKSVLTNVSLVSP